MRTPANKYSKMHLALADMALTGTALLGGEMVSSGFSPWSARGTGGGGWGSALWESCLCTALRSSPSLCFRFQQVEYHLQSFPRFDSSPNDVLFFCFKKIQGKVQTLDFSGGDLFGLWFISGTLIFNH